MEALLALAGARTLGSADGAGPAPKQMLQPLVEHLTDIINNVNPVDALGSMGPNAGGDAPQDTGGQRHLVLATYSAFQALYMAEDGLLGGFTARHLIPLLATLLLGVACIHRSAGDVNRGSADGESGANLSASASITVPLLDAAIAALEALLSCAKATELRSTLSSGGYDSQAGEARQSCFVRLKGAGTYDDAIGDAAATLCRHMNGANSAQVAERVYMVMASFLQRNNAGACALAAAWCRVLSGAFRVLATSDAAPFRLQANASRLRRAAQQWSNTCRDQKEKLAVKSGRTKCTPCFRA